MNGTHIFLTLSAAAMLLATPARAQLLYKEKVRALDSGCYKADFVSEKKTDFVMVHVSGQDARIVPSVEGNARFKASRTSPSSGALGSG